MFLKIQLLFHFLTRCKEDVNFILQHDFRAERHVTCSVLVKLRQMHDRGCMWWASVDNAVVTVALIASRLQLPVSHVDPSGQLAGRTDMTESYQTNVGS